MKKMNLNTPNQLTLIRMILTPIFLFVFTADFIPQHYFWGMLIFIVGSFTDFLDGKIARRYNLITTFGKLTDPIADKMLTTAALLVFLQDGMCSVWIPMIVLTREFAVASVRMVASSQGVVIPANIWGKLKTISQMVFTILIMILMIVQDNGMLPQSFNLPLFSDILLWITAVLTIVSGVIYVAKAAKVIDFTK